MLERLQHTSPAAGKIIGLDGTAHTIKLDKSATVLLPLLAPLQAWTTTDTPELPPVILNKHCPLCPFQQSCQAQAEQEDNLSLLHGVTARDIRQYATKGIFTVKQLSYLFKPRKPKKRSRKPPPVTYKVELHALAIREQKIYLHALPTLSRQPVELFLDIEGIPDRRLYYLIGLLVAQDNSTEYIPLWADTVYEERRMWQHFVAQVERYPDAPIYHYGSYEPRAIATLAKRYATDVASISKRLVNVHRALYGKVYFPVRSNGLKDIGHFLGARWTAPNASGLQSLVWRHQWEQTQEAQYRELLERYNSEDCQALRVVFEALATIHHATETVSEVDFVDPQKPRLSAIGQHISSQFKAIVQFSHFHYDKKKIRFRLEPPPANPNYKLLTVPNW